MKKRLFNSILGLSILVTPTLVFAAEDLSQPTSASNQINTYYEKQLNLDSIEDVNLRKIAQLTAMHSDAIEALSKLDPALPKEQLLTEMLGISLPIDYATPHGFADTKAWLRDNPVYTEKIDRLNELEKELNQKFNSFKKASKLTVDAAVTEGQFSRAIQILMGGLAEDYETNKEEKLKLLGNLYDLSGDNWIKVFINGVLVKTDQPVFEQNGRTLVPLRPVSELLGLSVEWDDASQTAKLTRGSDTISITLGSRTAVVNGSAVALDVPAEDVHGRMFVPVRFIAENFGVDVSYQEKGMMVLIEDRYE